MLLLNVKMSLDTTIRTLAVHLCRYSFNTVIAKPKRDMRFQIADSKRQNIGQLALSY